MFTSLLILAAIGAADAADGWVWAPPFPVVSTNPVHQGYRDQEPIATAPVKCTDPDLCPRTRQTGVIGAAVAYDSNWNVVSFDRHDGDPFAYCYQQHDAQDDHHLIGFALDIELDASGAYFWPGHNGSDGWPHALECTDTCPVGEPNCPAGTKGVLRTLLHPAHDTTGYPKVTIDPAVDAMTITLKANGKISDSGEPYRELNKMVKVKLSPRDYTHGWSNCKVSGSAWPGSGSAPRVRVFVSDSAENGTNDDFATYFVKRTADPVPGGSLTGECRFLLDSGGLPVIQTVTVVRQ